MSKSKVRCWRVENWRKGQASPDKVYITYPEDNFGHRLITCLRCGHVYSVAVAKMVYLGPSLEEKLRGMACVSCGCDLLASHAQYPENYFVDGIVAKYIRPIEIPPSSISLIEEFDEIYQ